MKLTSWCTLAFLFSVYASSELILHQPEYSTHDYYVIEHIPEAPASIHEVSAALDVELLNPIGTFESLWLARVPKSHKRNAEDVLRRYAELRTRANSLPNRRSIESLHAKNIVSSISALLPQDLRKRSKRDAYYAERAPPPSRPSINVNSSAQVVATRLQIEDPLFLEQWHLVNEEYPQNTMNVTGVWEDLGVTGKGVYIAMVDDGVDYTHDDLKANFFAEGSYDFNDHESLPTPKLSDDHHGTRCAGQISAVKNDVCGLGIAHDSKIAGIRILSGPISDVDEALALNFAYQKTSIYSCSWGPPDDGRSMEGPGYLIQKAVVKGITDGREGKGSLFVFASGNGASSGDQCNFDGYTNSIFSVTVGAIDYKGLSPFYSEACAANMIVTYSSGSGKNVVTTDVGQGKCTHSHGGTSAAAPFASAVFALALEARPELTWRDVQHLCITTAIQVNPDDPDWDKTAVGRPYSYKYGYGLLDAWRFVNAAKTWDLVKPQAWMDLPVVELGNGKVDEEGNMLGGLYIPAEGLSSEMTITSDMLVENNFESLEHVTVKIWARHTKRGDVEVELVSPGGIRSMLASPRPRDASESGFLGWTFMTLKHWGEQPVGTWTIRVFDQKQESQEGYFLGWTMSLFGSSVNATAAKPYVLKADTPSPGNVLPIPAPTAVIGTTKTYPKPTAHLPGDPAIATGEADKPAVDDTSGSTLDEGYFTGMSRLLKKSTWIVFSIAAIIVFGIGATLYFCWRQRRLRDYDPLSQGEDVPMVDHGNARSRGGNRERGRTRELYDAFGEVSDDEEASIRQPLAPNMDVTHPEYLENEPGSHYKDEPELKGRISPGSNDGSWEHA